MLEQVGLKKEDIDIYEVRICICARTQPLNLMYFQINEAFASQFAYCVDELGVPIEKINPKCVLQLLRRWLF
jgi:acetyl-CoA acyltransferase 1